MQITRKQKINWLIKEDSVVVFDTWQATCYLDISAKSKKRFDEFKEELINNESEYNNWVDIVCLAQRKEMIGYGTKVKKEWF